MNSFLFLLLLKILHINSSIPNWDMESVSMNLFSTDSTRDEYKYDLYNSDGFLLQKIITKDGDKIKYKNYLTYNGGDGREVDFERFESKYWNQLGVGIVICPKGSFHPYDFYDKKYIKSFEGEGNWDLSCYSHETGYFIMFYAHNGGNYIYYAKGNNGNIKRFDGGFGELYSYKLPEYTNKGKNYEYRLPSLLKWGDYLKLSGYSLILNDDENEIHGNTIQGEKTLIKAKSYTQWSITSDYYLYYFTYNNISDFSSGYSNND